MILKVPGSKTKYLDQLRPHLARLLRGETDYAEPFVGGGAVLDYVAAQFPHLRLHANDLNPGSHRIAAAIKAGLESIPCYVISERRLRRLPGDVDAQFGHVDDSERLRIIRQTGDEGAIHLMWLEGRA